MIQLTIPKLELSAALIGARIVKYLKLYLNVTKIVLWSDSLLLKSNYQFSFEIESANLEQNSSFCERISKVFDIQRYVSYQKLLRITEYAYRFIHNCRQNTELAGKLSVKEIEIASNAWIRDAQIRNYPDVIESLNNKSTKHPLVKQLRLYWDNMNIIRCGGRINNAPVSE